MSDSDDFFDDNTNDTSDPFSNLDAYQEDSSEATDYGTHGFGTSANASDSWESGDAEKSSGGVPTWVWIVGGIGIVAVLCCAIAGAAVFFIGQTAEGVFDEITGTLESGGFEATIEAAFETPVASSQTDDSQVDPTPVPSNTTSDDILATSDEPIYEELFNRTGSWGTGEVISDDGSTVEAIGDVTNGVFDFTAYEPGLYWSTGGETFEDGIYEVWATAVDGPIDNGFGMMFMVDDDQDDFYLFEISSDGFVWIGLCRTGCEEVELLVDDGWFSSDAINLDLNNINRLRVEVLAGTMSFYVNDQSVGRATDFQLDSGDIGLFVESFSEDDIRIEFDNFTFTPWQ